jgi:hypothetical protein
MRYPEVLKKLVSKRKKRPPVGPEAKVYCGLGELTMDVYGAHTAIKPGLTQKLRKNTVKIAR